jgi:hypothetical protein
VTVVVPSARRRGDRALSPHGFEYSAWLRETTRVAIELELLLLPGPFVVEDHNFDDLMQAQEELREDIARVRRGARPKGKWRSRWIIILARRVANPGWLAIGEEQRAIADIAGTVLP